MSDLLNLYQGALLGLAIGDALGAPVEFKKVGEFEPVTDFRYCEHFDLPPGCWSDDTAMALCLANSLIEKQSFDPYDHLHKYKRWLEEGYCTSTGRAVGVGQTILRSLLLYKDGDEPYVREARIYSEGNGSLMRIAPIPLYFRNNPALALENAVLSSLVTHGASICSDCCQYYTGLIIGALNGVTKEELLSDLYCPVVDYYNTNPLHEEVLAVAKGSFRDNEPPFITPSGYVPKTMEMALWAFSATDTFKDGLLKAVNYGGDADTVGAIYGQLAGAYYGKVGIPEMWVNKVAKSEEIMSVAVRLCVKD